MLDLFCDDVLIYQQVFGFDVLVDDVQVMEVFEGVQQVVDYVVGVFFCVFSGQGDVIKQVFFL